ncbi:MAG: 30S ribosomal protein S3ae [Sulfolobales archaeon]
MPAPRVSGREKWKYKKWFTVLSPSILGEIPIATIPADDSSKILNRSIEVTLYDLTGDVSQLHMRFILKIIGVEDSTARTAFREVYLSRDYLRSLTKRKSSKISLIANLETKDGSKLRISAVAFTTYTCKTSQKKLIRRNMYNVISEISKQSTLDEIIKDVISGKIQSQLFEVAKKIYPVRKVEIAKIKILS